MKLRIAALFAAAAFASACDNAATGPNAARDATLLQFDVQATMDSATLVPRGPAYDNEGPPDALRLTDAQKTAIKALHDAFAAAHTAQFDQLKAIREEARAAIKAGKTRAPAQAESTAARATAPRPSVLTIFSRTAAGTGLLNRKPCISSHWC